MIWCLVLRKQKMCASQKIFSIAFSPKFGRHLISARDIEPGEVVIDEPALVEGPSSYGPTVCPVCYSRLEEESHVTCQTCSLPVCSLACSKSGLHSQNECQLFRKVPALLGQVFDSESTKDLYNFITTSRALFFKSRDPTKWSQMLELESRAEALKESDPLFFHVIDQAFQHLSWEIFDVHGEKDPVNLLRDAHHCLGVLRTNSYSEFTQRKGMEGLYFFSSLMSHSCVMNTGRQFGTGGSGSRLVVRAATRIEKGEQITSTYVPFLNNTRERQEEMIKVWGFSCDCTRCGSLTEIGTFLGSIKCPNCDHLTLCPFPSGDRDWDWKCATANCGQVFTDHDHEICNILDSVVEVQNSVPDLEELKAGDWLETSTKRGILHPNHSLFVQIKLYLCQSYGKEEGVANLSDEQVLRKARYCQEVISICNQIYPDSTHLFKGKILFELWSSLREVMNRKIKIIHLRSLFDLCNDSSTRGQDLEKVVKDTAYDAFGILQHSIPLSAEASMFNLLQEEYEL